VQRSSTFFIFFLEAGDRCDINLETKELQMAEQNESHFQVQDENKARKFEANKKKREEVKQFIDRCDERKLTEIHAEVTRLKRGFYL
jgi:replication fork clamp-binding protein CrfC